MLLWLAVTFLAGISAAAQSVSFSGSMLPLPGTSAFIHPQGVALDSSGDLYIADSGNNAIREMTLVDSVYQAPVSLPAPSGGYNSPVGVAVARNGDVFVGDTGNGAIERIPYGCTSSACVVTIGAPGTINFPLGVALDSAGNVFVANSGLNQIVEIPALGDYLTTTIVATGFVTPAGVAVDDLGNVFVASYGDSAVFEVPLVGGVYQPRQTIGSGFNKPNGVALDSDGSLLIADTHNSVIKEIAAADISSAAPTIITIAGGFSLPVGVVADLNGNLFIGDYGSSTSNGALYEFMRHSVDFGLVPIGSTSPALTLTFTFSANTTLQAPIVVTQGAAGSDFADAGTGSCTTAAAASHAYAPGDICTLSLTLTPAQSGLSLGAAELKDASGNLLATVPLFGTGTGPQIVFDPGVRTTKGSGFNAPAGLAADQGGTIYVADSGNNQIQVIGNGSTFPISGFASPQSVALDGAGNIFIADTGNNAVKEIVAATGTTISLGGGFAFSGPSGVSVDRAGNLYVADTGNGAVQELSAAAGYSTVSTIRSGFSSPSAIAVDYLGDVFVVDTSSTPVREIVAADGAVNALSPLQAVGSGWSAPAAIACDRLGNLYVADAGQAVELSRNGTTFGSPQLLASGLASPTGIAVDARGNVDISSASKNEVLQLQLST
ncbi:MAG TPA: NHL repeat-containing protein, partial [Acidobacteriaceae bacterium]|nr:NHL repeat-containing protein [Acidobacteriaceae bacterium]